MKGLFTALFLLGASLRADVSVEIEQGGPTDRFVERVVMEQDGAKPFVIAEWKRDEPHGIDPSFELLVQERKGNLLVVVYRGGPRTSMISFMRGEGIWKLVYASRTWIPGAQSLEVDAAGSGDDEIRLVREEGYLSFVEDSDAIEIVRNKRLVISVDVETGQPAILEDGKRKPMPEPMPAEHMKDDVFHTPGK